jgi:hypothetical protein
VHERRSRVGDYLQASIKNLLMVFYYVTVAAFQLVGAFARNYHMTTDIFPPAGASAEEESLQPTWVETIVTWGFMVFAVLIVSGIAVLMGRA